MLPLRFFAAALTLAWGLGECAPTPEGPPSILVLGDSLSAAYGLSSAEGWVALLQIRLKARSLDYRVVNASISGETTAGGLARLPTLLAEHRPRILAIALGANDGLRGFGFDTIRTNLIRMVSLGKESGAQTLIAGVRLPPNYGAGYTDAFQAVFRAVAQAEEIPLIPDLLDGVSQKRALMQPDGLHPTAQAQPRILENVWERLGPMLDPAEAPP